MTQMKPLAADRRTITAANASRTNNFKRWQNRKGRGSPFRLDPVPSAKPLKGRRLRRVLARLQTANINSHLEKPTNIQTQPYKAPKITWIDRLMNRFRRTSFARAPVYATVALSLLAVPAIYETVRAQVMPTPTPGSTTEQLREFGQWVIENQLHLHLGGTDTTIKGFNANFYKSGTTDVYVWYENGFEFVSASFGQNQWSKPVKTQALIGVNATSIGISLDGKYILVDSILENPKVAIIYQKDGEVKVTQVDKALYHQCLELAGVRQ